MIEFMLDTANIDAISRLVDNGNLNMGYQN
jgi:hypothetical protein